DSVDTLLSTLEMLDRDRKAAAAKLDVAESAARPPATLGEVKTVTNLLRKAKKKDERAALRLKVRGRIRQLVAEIWILVQDLDYRLRIGDVQIHFHGGGIRFLTLVWIRRGHKRGHVAWGGSERLPMERNHLFGVMDLRHYRDEPKVRDYFGQCAGMI